MRWLLLLLVACGGAPADAPARPGGGPVPVKVLTMASSPIALDVEAWGSLLAERVVELKPESTGAVVTVSFTDGQRVHAGDVLVKLRDGEPKATRGEAEAALALAEADLARATTLRAQQTASQADVDAATARRDLARIGIDRAAESMRRTSVKAPFDGWLGERRVDEGDVITPSDVVAVLMETDPIRAAVTVPERLAGWVREGLPATVRVDSWPDLSFTGQVVYTAPSVDEATRTLTVHVSVPNPESKLRPGMTARAVLQLGAPADTMLVPAEAVTTTADGPRLWVVTEGAAHLRPVTTGERRDADIVVNSGIAPGEQVVIEGLVRLREGAPVRVITP